MLLMGIINYLDWAIFNSFFVCLPEGTEPQACPNIYPMTSRPSRARAPPAEHGRAVVAQIQAPLRQLLCGGAV